MDGVVPKIEPWLSTMRLPRIEFRVPDTIRIPPFRLWRIALASPGPVPPIVMSDPLWIVMPSRALPRSIVPVASVPRKLP